MFDDVCFSCLSRLATTLKLVLDKSFFFIFLDIEDEKQEEIEVNVTEESEKLQIPTIKIEHCDNETTENSHFNNSVSTPPNSVQSVDETNDDHDDDLSTGQQSPSCEPDTSAKENEGDIQETLADIAQNFTSKLDSIRSSFTLSLDRNVASCLGKNK